MALLCLLPVTTFAQIGVRKSDTALVTVIDGHQQVFKTDDYYKKQLDSKLKTNYLTYYGGLANGVFDNTAAFALAKTAIGTKKPIYFPQNGTGDAVYYFTTSPSFSGYMIAADEGVKISVPTTNFITFNTSSFLTKIQIISRDRNNTGQALSNSAIPDILLPLANLDKTEQLTDLVSIDGAYFKKRLYNIASNTFVTGATSTATTTQITWSNASVAASASADSLTFDVAVQPAVPGVEYSAALTTSANATGGRGGIFVQASGEWVFFGLSQTGYKLISKKTATPATYTYITNKVSGAYTLSTTAQPEVSVRFVSDTVVEFYVNGYKVYTYKMASYVTDVGFGFNRSLNVAGFQNAYNFTSATSTNRVSGGVLKLGIFGDSISYGEGSSFSWVDLIKKILIGRNGISDVQTTNYSISGQKAAQQYTLLSTTNVSGFDYTLVLVGTNDATTLDADFRVSIQDIITKIKSDGSIPIIGVYPMTINSESTGIGFGTGTAYAMGGIHRTSIKQLCAVNGVLMADALGFMGEVGASNKQTRDNVHPETFFQATIAKAFATALLSDKQKVVNSIRTTNGLGLFSGSRYNSFVGMQAFNSTKDTVNSQILLQNSNGSVAVDYTGTFSLRVGANLNTLRPFISDKFGQIGINATPVTGSRMSFIETAMIPVSLNVQSGQKALKIVGAAGLPAYVVPLSSGELTFQNDLSAETFRIGGNGDITAAGKSKSTQYILSDLNTSPLSATDTGTKGEIRVTAGFIYVCTAANTWVRTSLTTW